MKNIIKSIMAIFGIAYATTANAQAPEKAEDICPLLIGETLPKATLQNPDGKMIQLNDVLAEKPSVLVFYRGGWCPYCNLQLSGLLDVEKDIVELGYQILAISPDDFQNLKNTEEKGNISYQLFSDPSGTFIQDIGIAFQTSTMVKGYIATKGQKGKTSNVMPVPTVLIVDKKGVIQFEYINPNYKERISGEMLLAVLKSFKK
jgi:peroxiredoxin